MEPTQPEPTLDESIAQVMQTLPPIIRTYLAQGRYTTVARNLMAKYNLRIDQGGVLEREIMLLLMGIETPDEFTQALAEDASLDRQVISSIVKDVNDQVFVPLRKEEEGQSREAPAQQAQGAPLPPKVVMPQVVRATGSLGDVVRSVLTTGQPANELLLEDHEEPHIELKAIPPQPTVAPPAPEPAPQVARQAAAPRAPMPQPRPTTVITAYTSDPYREPIDEGK